MRLSQLQIRNFRNLVQVDLEPGAGINLITGSNASGKTSLLEAIYYISHLRSFRTPYLADLINHNMRRLQLFARVTSNGHETPVGIRRSRDQLEVRADQRPLKRVADLAALIPVLAIHPDSYKLLTGSPSQRRQFIDWGVFHVEHGFYDAWQRYRKALSQRNAALKSNQKIAYCTVWDHQLDSAASHIDRLREVYISELQPVMLDLVTIFFPQQTVSIEYRRGWKAGMPFSEALNASLERDRRRGFTTVGPHHAELVILVNGKSAQTSISRGQQKLMVALLRLSQVQRFIESSDRRCVLLYDDLPAELDSHNRHKVLEVLENLPIQIFLTAIDRVDVNLPSGRLCQLFHVEHGCVYQQD